MKNKLTLVLVGLMTVLSFGFFSCKKETNVTQNTGAYNYYALVNQSQWTYNNQTGEYFKSIDLSNLPNDFIFYLDGVVMYVTTYTQSGSNLDIDPLNAMNGNGTLFNGYYYYFQAHEDQDGPYVTIYAKPSTTGAPAPSSNLYFSIVLLQAQDMGQLSNSTKNDFEQLKKVINIKTIPAN
ncbi:MAG: hypothetical protein DI598_06665 [Pseudopedobacter saltans]|uniref:Lipoprotein n=1 Tax=Pseudopedobacter saltans TaxID=151895 RepID=A0A2W5F8F5_9SPHI|nr:MAG: hypothetical protein DI598_06665 [Pseudopedobacter saltans]